MSQRVEATLNEARRAAETAAKTYTVTIATIDTAVRAGAGAAAAPPAAAPPSDNTAGNTLPADHPRETWLSDIVNNLSGEGASGAFFNSVIARIGAVLIGIFLIQILVGFSRYNYKLSEHLSACADMVRISRGDAKLMKDLASVMLSTIDFGKMPSSPFQKIVDTSMDTIKELAKKIPER